jgi:hypothetical protein
MVAIMKAGGGTANNVSISFTSHREGVGHGRECVDGSPTSSVQRIPAVEYSKEGKFLNSAILSHRHWAEREILWISAIGIFGIA